MYGSAISSMRIAVMTRARCLPLEHSCTAIALMTVPSNAHVVGGDAVHAGLGEQGSANDVAAPITMQRAPVANYGKRLRRRVGSPYRVVSDPLSGGGLAERLQEDSWYFQHEESRGARAPASATKDR